MLLSSITCKRLLIRKSTFPTSKAFRTFTTQTTLKMPEPLKQSEVEKGQDPSVTKQFDGETPTDQKFEDMYAIADKLKIGMLGTYRPGVGVRWIQPIS